MSKEKNAPRNPGMTGPAAGYGGTGVVSVTSPVSLPFGAASAVLRDGILFAVEWRRSRKDLRAALSAAFPGAREIPAGECDAGRLLRRYSEGRPIRPGDVARVPVDWERVRPFQRKVLRELVRVPYGETISYGELAARIGSPDAARAVGGALSRNPWPVIVPCHRVVGARGDLVGFGKGISAKRILLAFEKKRSLRDLLGFFPEPVERRQVRLVDGTS